MTGTVWNVQVIDADSGEIRSFPDFEVTVGGKEYNLGQIDKEHFVLEFSFKRTSGRKGLKITFGRTENNNYLQWEFGGWDNWDCNLISMQNGRSSVISHRIFHVDEREYRLKLEVEKCHIRTWVNGEKFNDAVYRLPELEELYVAASKDAENGKTILKVVNLTGEEKNVQICLEGTPKKLARAVFLRGHELSQENTFEEPNRIMPEEEEVPVDGNQAEYIFMPHSFTVLVFE